MGSWKGTKIKVKTRHRKGMRLEWEGALGARRRKDIGFWARSVCEGAGVPYRIELWLEGRTGCAWPGAEILEQNCSIWSERNTFRAVGGCGYLIITLFLLVPEVWWNSLPQRSNKWFSQLSQLPTLWIEGQNAD